MLGSLQNVFDSIVVAASCMCFLGERGKLDLQNLSKFLISSGGRANLIDLDSLFLCNLSNINQFLQNKLFVALNEPFHALHVPFHLTASTFLKAVPHFQGSDSFAEKPSF